VTTSRAKIRFLALHSVNRHSASIFRREVISHRITLRHFAFWVCAGVLAAAWTLSAAAQSSELELTRTIRSWEFLPIVGTRAGLLGNESGRFEAWAYPLKIFRDLHLIFHVGDRALPAESLARTLTVRPESASIVYAGDSFRVRETLCVPVEEPGAVIVLEIETDEPVEVEAAFTADFQLEWPAAVGGTYIGFDPGLHAFVFGEESRKYEAIFGSPTGTDAHVAYETNYSSSQENSFRLGVIPKGKETKTLVFAASVNGMAEAEKSYQHLVSSYGALIEQSASYYRGYLSKTVGLELPDIGLQQAYDWARISTLQGLVNNPYLGTGLVAGYRTSGVSQRPGFAWFFGRDSFWTSFALNSEGDFSTSHAALDFVSRFQREDGKVPHEISQSASLVPWFKDFPYPWASADATPLFILAMDDYATQSGNLSFVREKWDNLWRAYQFLKSTYDSQGFAQNMGVGHGWVEGGPLLPVKNEYYQAGLGVAAVGALSNLAGLVGKPDISQQLRTEFERAKPALDQAFWSPEANIYAFALKQDNQRVQEASVLATVPMWFGLPDIAHANTMISRLSAADQETDWGMRIISSQSPVYSGSGYHFGSVWPLFTGWASVGEYRYHRALAAYSNLRANALLFRDGTLGHFSEVLSGDYNDSLSTSSPHQIWSAAMVISPILRGMFGLATDTQKHQITFSPHTPADWSSFSIHNIQLGEVKLDLRSIRTAEATTLEIERRGSGEFWLEYSPSFSPRAQIVSVEMNGKPLRFTTERNIDDQHMSVRVPLSESRATIVIRVRNDFGLSLEQDLPPLGSASRGIRILDELWNSAHDQLDLNVAGLAGHQYELAVWNPEQIVSVTGGVTNAAKLQIQIPSGPKDSYVQQKIRIRFAHP
jgi:glycogen debranching enzyme